MGVIVVHSASFATPSQMSSNAHSIHDSIVHSIEDISSMPVRTSMPRPGPTRGSLDGVENDVAAFRKFSYSYRGTTRIVLAA